MKLSVIIVSYNRFDLLERAIGAVRAGDMPFDHEIIVVDNASAGDIEAFLRPRYTDMTLIRNRENRGFGRANNQGAAVAKGEYLLLLNSDAYPEKDAIRKLVERMDSRPEIAVLAPLILNPDHSFQLSYGGRISFFSEFRQKYLLPRREGKKMRSTPRRDVWEEKAWVSGACMLVRGSHFPDRRLFDESYFLYFEDHELCLRVREMGKYVVYWSEPAVIHSGGQSVAGYLSTPVEYRRSQLLLYRRFASKMDYALLKYYLRAKYSFACARLKRRNDEAARSKLRNCERILELVKKNRGGPT